MPEERIPDDYMEDESTVIDENINHKVIYHLGLGLISHEKPSTFGESGTRPNLRRPRKKEKTQCN